MTFTAINSILKVFFKIFICLITIVGFYVSMLEVKPFSEESIKAFFFGFIVSLVIVGISIIVTYLKIRLPQ